MRKPLILTLAVAALAGCSAHRPESAGARASTSRSLSVETNSWGKPVTNWTIGADGEGRYSFSRDVPGGGFRDYDLVTMRFAVSAANFAKVEGLLAEARPFAGAQIPCTLRITDGLYGRIGWNDGAAPLTVPFNVGCLSPTAEAIYHRLRDAQDLVKALADAGETVEVQEVREPRG